MMRRILALISLAGAVAMQGWVWSGPFTDDDVWVRRVAQLYTDLGDGYVQGDNPVYSGHPGAPILLLGAGFMSLDFSSEMAIRLSTVALVLLAGGLAIWLAAELRLAPYWEWVVGGVSLLSATYGSASPTNAVAGAGLVALVVGVIWLWQKKPRRMWPWLLWGASWGALLSVRLPAVAIIGGAAWLWLWFALRDRRVWSILLVATMSAFVFDPLAWFTPWAHLQYVLGRSSLNFTEAVPAMPLHGGDFLLHAPLALLGILLTATALLFHPRKIVIRIEFWWLMLLASSVYLGLFLQVRAQSLRHFQPLLMWWELAAALWILHWVTAADWERFPQEQRVAVRNVLSWTVIVLIVGMNVWLLVQVA